MMIKEYNNCQIFIPRYDSNTGVFTVPHGGDGVYYFSVYVLVEDGEGGIFDMRLNDDVICTTFPDHSFSGDLDFASGSCSAVVNVIAGNGYFTRIMNFGNIINFLEVINYFYYRR